MLEKFSYVINYVINYELHLAPQESPIRGLLYGLGGFWLHGSLPTVLAFRSPFQETPLQP